MRLALESQLVLVGRRLEALGHNKTVVDSKRIKILQQAARTMRLSLHTDKPDGSWDMVDEFERAIIKIQQGRL